MPSSYGRSVQRYTLLGPQERLPGRPFTDPERTLADAEVMDRMLQRLRLEARSWPAWRTSVEVLRYTRAGGRHWLVVPNAPTLGGAQEVTAVGFLVRRLDRAPVLSRQRERPQQLAARRRL